jgi:hypothetical protein
MPDNPSAPSRESAIVTVPGVPGIHRWHAKGHARGDRCGCAYLIGDRGPGGQQESNTIRAEPLAERVEQPAAGVARRERPPRGGEA